MTSDRLSYNNMTLSQRFNNLSTFKMMQLTSIVNQMEERKILHWKACTNLQSVFKENLFQSKKNCFSI